MALTLIDSEDARTFFTEDEVGRFEALEILYRQADRNGQWDEEGHFARVEEDNTPLLARLILDDPDAYIKLDKQEKEFLDYLGYKNPFNYPLKYHQIYKSIIRSLRT